MRQSQLAAVLTADLHFWHRPPAAREAEPDWFRAMGRVWAQVISLLKPNPEAALIIAGDIFDRPNAPPELINWVLDRIPPNAYAVPGQHDLLHHSYKDIKKSAYWTLVRSGKLTNLEPGAPVEHGSLRLHGFPWGYGVKPYRGPKHDLVRDIAVVHAFVWTRSTGHEGASAEHRVKAYRPKLDGYDLSVFGDNHKPFGTNDPPIFNCGSLTCRTTAQRDYTPSVGLLYQDGRVERHYLDVSRDGWSDLPQVPEPDRGKFQALMDRLERLQGKVADYKEVMLRALEDDNVSGDVRRLILEAMNQ